jgi:hypothetical protein
MEPLPPPLAGTELRILATSDLGATTMPLRASWGAGGTCAGVVALLEREQERQPTIWLDAGDLVVGSPAYPLLGERPWEELTGLPIAAAAVGNHEFDDGVDALLQAAPRLSFPLLCANVDVGLPPTAVVDTAAGPVGVIGLTHPRCDALTASPPLAADWPERVAVHARELGAAGARWVVALLHEGVTWWPADEPGGEPIATRSDHLDAVARPWAAHVDLVLGGHNFGCWTGTLGGRPAGEPHLFAASLVVVDLGERPVVRGVVRVPAMRPREATPARAAIAAAGERIVGELPDGWLTRTGAPHYLPDLIAGAFRTATGADAGLVLPNFHGIQAPLDGAIGALGPGPVTELDVVRLAGDPDYDPVVVELRPAELQAAVDVHWATADPRIAAGDRVPWNRCRMPPGVSVGAATQTSVAVLPALVGHLAEWLGREVVGAPGGVRARDALTGALL